MSDWPWIEIWTAVYAVTTVGILIAAIATVIPAINQLRFTKATRQFELWNRLSDRWEADQLRNARRTATASANLARDLQTYERENREEYFTLIQLANFFEDLGLLARQDSVAAEVIRERFTFDIQYYYSLFSPYIARLQMHNPHIYENFEHLTRSIEAHRDD